MKKKIAALCAAALSAAICVSAAGAFNDITDPQTELAADVLAYMNVVNGMGGDEFQPGGTLTRAQFCKMVMAAKEQPEAILSYKNYTIFPDVPYNYWGSAYINMAVMQKISNEEGSTQTILQGYPDGTFKPENNLTLGEAATVALRLLGYQTGDIGLFWPDDYVAKAREIGLLQDIDANANDALNRGETAILIYNLLLTENKSGTMFVKDTVYKGFEEDRVILADSSTDDELTTNQVRISELVASDDKAPTYTVEKTVPATLMGQKGIVLFGSSSNSGAVKGFVPYRGTRRSITVSKVTASAITGTDGSVSSISNNVPVILNGKIQAYGSCFFDLLPGSTLTLTYDRNGKMESISLSAGTGNSGPYVLQTDGTAGNPLASVFPYQNGTVYKNGARVEISALRKYDVVTFDKASNTYYATDVKVTGKLMDATPALQNPSQVKVLGKTFPVLEAARGDFSNAKLGELYTLLLTASGQVAGAVPATVFTQVQYAVLDSAEGANIKFSLLPNGLALEATADSAGYGALVGQLVRVTSTQDAKVSLSKVTYSNAGGDFSVKDRTLGGKNLSPNVKVYEMVNGFSSSPALLAVDLENINYTDVVQQKYIAGVLNDSGGNPMVVVLQNATGEGYIYGKISVGFTTVSDGNGEVSHEESTIGVTNAAGTTSGGITSDAQKSGMYGGLAFSTKGQAIARASLTRRGDAKLADFNGTEEVTVNGKQLKIPPNVVVYVKDTDTFMDLKKAKALCTSFSIYVNEEAAYNNVVRLIEAS